MTEPNVCGPGCQVIFLLISLVLSLFYHICCNIAHTEITPMCSRSELSVRKTPIPKYVPIINKMVSREHLCLISWCQC